MQKRFEEYLKELPVVAIIRGVTPDEVIMIADALYRAGIKIIEVPLNSPDPFTSIQRLSQEMGSKCIIGAGTVLTKEDVGNVAKAGGQIVVTPNSDPEIIKDILDQNMIPLAGFATASEAFMAVKAGAVYLKLFPASTYGAAHVKALKAVLPKDISVFAVGGVGADNAEEWLAAQIDGFGIGSEFYEKGDTADEVFEKASKAVKVIKKAIK